MPPGKIENALNEARMLVLGTQVLLGFQLRSIFESGFERLDRTAQLAALVGLVLLAVTLVLLLATVAFNQIVERGEATERLHDFATRVSGLALVPFAVALGVECYVGTWRVLGGASAAFGATVGGTALFMWFGLEVAHRARHGPHPSEEKSMEKDTAETKLSEKIKHVLLEAVVVLPGAQALLGFQLIATLMLGFDELPAWAQGVHVGSLAFVTVATILLMTPAAYHRLVEVGENSEHFHTLASRMVLAAMACLPIGVCGDVFVVVVKVTGVFSVALAVSLALLTVFYGLWFGYTLVARGRLDGARPVGESVRFQTEVIERGG